MRTGAVALLVVALLAGCTALPDPPGQSTTCTQQLWPNQNPTTSTGTYPNPSEYSALTGQRLAGEGFVPAHTYDARRHGLIVGKNVTADLYVSNREGEQTEYTVVIQLHEYTYIGDVESDNATLTVRNRTTLARSSVTVPDGERAGTNATFTVPNASGDYHRLAILLYDCAPPEPPTADYTVTQPWYLGVNVLNESEAAGATGHS